MKLAAIAAAAVLATGCATKAQTGALIGGVVGAAALGPVGGTAAVHWAIGALGASVGAVFGGAIGKQLDEKDRGHIATSIERSSTETWTSHQAIEESVQRRPIRV